MKQIPLPRWKNWEGIYLDKNTTYLLVFDTMKGITIFNTINQKKKWTTITS